MAETHTKLAGRIAGEIRAEIQARHWPVGERLGSEPELIARFGVSRAVFREAIRILEREEIAVMRRGPNGGLFVTAPEARTAVTTMSNFLDFAGVTAYDVYDARRALEMRAVELATRNLDEDGIHQLRGHLEYEESHQESDIVGAAHNFHLLVAQLTGNDAFLLFMDCAIDLSWRFSRRSPGAPKATLVGPEIHHAHARIAAAMISDDAALAQHHMGRHMDAIMRSLANDGGRARVRASDEAAPVAFD